MKVTAMKFVVKVAIAACVLSQPTYAQSQRACGDRTAIINRLSQKYGEEPISRGLSHTNAMIEVFASEETGTFTILMTSATGQSCLVAAGEHWQKAPMIKRSGQPT